MPSELISPELALVDPELRVRARAALPDHLGPPLRPTPSAKAASAAAAPPAETRHRRSATYPLWARLTAMLWVFVLGILIGGAAVPHAQDRPRVVPIEEDATICERPQQSNPRPTPPSTGAPRG